MGWCTRWTRKLSRGFKMRFRIEKEQQKCIPDYFTTRTMSEEWPHGNARFQILLWSWITQEINRQELNPRLPVENYPWNVTFPVFLSPISCVVKFSGIVQQTCRILFADINIVALYIPEICWLHHVFCTRLRVGAVKFINEEIKCTTYGGLKLNSPRLKFVSL